MTKQKRMKHGLTGLIILFCSLSSWGQTSKKACFLGNSYTYVNDLPALVSNLAMADGNVLIYDQNTPGGYTLEGHASNATSLAKIAADEWDFVILQDQSQRPSFPWSQVSEEVFPFAESLCEDIREANECAIPLFYNTWGRRDGDDQWDSINTFTKMNQRLHTAYDFMADKNSGMLAPIGIGFQHIDNDATSPITHAALYSGDGSHPSIFGSYLAACIFYELIFTTTAEGNTYVPTGISTAEAEYLQTVAHHVTHETDSVTTNYTNPTASFTVAYDGLTATFTNTSVHAFEYEWDFGDGTTSTEESPVHTYPDAGPYTATLIALYCGRQSTSVGGDPDPAGINDETTQKLVIYPNPSSNQQVNVVIPTENQLLEIYTLDGQLFRSEQFSAGEHMISLPTGVYIFKVNAAYNKVIIH